MESAKNWLGAFVSTNFASKLVLIAVSGIIVHLARNKLRRGLRDIPGPALAAYTGLWRLYDVHRGQAHRTAITLHQRYGPLVRIGPNHVSISDPREINNIYGLKAGYTKTAFYPIQSITYKGKVEVNLFGTRDEAYHREMKRHSANAYSLTSLLASEPKIDSCTRLFVKKLAEFADIGNPVDLGEWLQYYTFDVIGELSFGRKLGFLDVCGDVDGMIKTIEDLLGYASHCGQIPEMHKFLFGNPLLPYIIPSMVYWNQVLNFTLKVVDDVVGDENASQKTTEHDVESLAQKGDMLSKWYAMQLSDPDKMSTRDLIVHLSTNVFAGSDTTAIALRAIFYYLARDPEKMRKLVQEIDDAAIAGNLSEPVSYRESSLHLPYLNAVIKEGMRIHPSVGLLLERHVPPGGAIICGKHIPGGTIVGINAWVTQHDPDVFPKPFKFEPERWLNASENQLKLMEQSFFAFGAGARTCIGRHIAMVQMAKVIPELLRRFEVSLTMPGQEWKTKNVWFVQQEGLICNLKNRTQLISRT